MGEWYRMQAAGDGAEIDIFEEIGGWGINAKDFKRELEKMDRGGTIRVSINSPGGDVFDGLAIYGLLSERRERVEVEVYGLAASIASVIALAGRELYMREGTFFMIHDPWSLVIGDSEEMRHTANILDKIGDQILGIYAAHTALTDDELRAAMREETWYTADEAVEVGFAARVVGQKVAASINFTFLNQFRNAPVGGEKTQADESLIIEEETMENQVTEKPQAGNQPGNETGAAIQALEEKIGQVQASFEEKLASITVRPNTRRYGDDVNDAETLAFYDTLKEAIVNRGRFQAAADTIVTSDGIGIPVPAAQEILANLNRMSIMRRFGAEVRGTTAPQTRFTTVVDNSTPGFLPEDGDYSDTAEPVLVSLDLHKIPGRISITEEQAEDAVVEAMSILRRHAPIHIAKTENLGFLVGSGTGQPSGVTAGTASVTAAATGAVTFDELVQLDESLDPDWRWSVGSLENGDYVGPIYICNSATAEALRVLQDTNSNYFFRNHEENGMSELFGKPLIRNNNIPAMGANEKAITLVHPAAYLIGERRPQYAIQIGYDYNKHRTLMDFNVRVGGQVWDADGVAILQMAAT